MTSFLRFKSLVGSSGLGAEYQWQGGSWKVLRDGLIGFFWDLLTIRKIKTEYHQAYPLIYPPSSSLFVSPAFSHSFTCHFPISPLPRSFSLFLSLTLSLSSSWYPFLSDPPSSHKLASISYIKSSEGENTKWEAPREETRISLFSIKKKRRRRNQESDACCAVDESPGGLWFALQPVWATPQR